MKKIILLLSLIAVCNHAFSQEWITNFEEAKEEASAKRQNIILVFQGSDWCAPCIKLDKEIWSTSEFKKLANNHFVMLKADFPRRKVNKLSESLQKQNNMLAESYNNQGYFPLVVMLNKEGKILGKMGYEKTSPTNYFQKLKAFEI